MRNLRQVSLGMTFFALLLIWTVLSNGSSTTAQLPESTAEALTAPLPLATAVDANTHIYQQMQMPDMDDANAVPLLNAYTGPPTLNWVPYGWANLYVVQIASDRGFQNIVVRHRTTQTTFTPTDLTAGVWYWRVRARYAPAIAGAWSSIGSFVIEPE